jgi:hypothetical protein
MSISPEEYRHFAENCRRLATEVRTVEGRHTLIYMADRWERLASELESSVARSSGTVTSLQEWSHLRPRR